MSFESLQILADTSASWEDQTPRGTLEKRTNQVGPEVSGIFKAKTKKWQNQETDSNQSKISIDFLCGKVGPISSYQMSMDNTSNKMRAFSSAKPLSQLDPSFRHNKQMMKDWMMLMEISRDIPLLIKGKKYMEALTKVEQGLKLGFLNNDQRGGFYRDRARVLNCQHKYQEALETIEIAFALNPSHLILKVGLFIQKSHALYLLGRGKEALEASQKGIELLPDSSLNIETRHLKAALCGQNALALHFLGRYEEALEEVERGIALNPFDINLKATLFLYRATSLNALHRYEEAQQAAQNGIDLNSTDVQKKSLLGRQMVFSLRQLHRDEEANEILQKNIQLISSNQSTPSLPVEPNRGGNRVDNLLKRKMETPSGQLSKKSKSNSSTK